MDHVDPGWSMVLGMERLCRGTVKGYDVGRADFYSYKNAVVELKYICSTKTHI
jgi:hypothetical protein